MYDYCSFTLSFCYISSVGKDSFDRNRVVKHDKIKTKPIRVDRTILQEDVAERDQDGTEKTRPKTLPTAHTQAAGDLPQQDGSDAKRKGKFARGSPREPSDTPSTA